ncbi:MAG: holo-[acyl-carrier-protein] synthase [Ignavibacteriales bacterium UTCHB2]|jgi:holo-[acyl-carrier protein] synthase|nr:MAG: Holo-(acyl-carrier-protein) synthase [Ignavibacteria bacterium ADurb.Bin266]OQY71043.1 MAG: holo-[acyl-carrier-protein] synthase [Ignavibacteriales bacterium UTCHB2]HQI42002.1 holo-ACP synthase [Ignavibacteriaceae bacterium]HQJ47320.1 holo-ACP synthase [Ignavibacteriaceae bacterium]
MILGIGIDIIEIDRIKNSVDTFGDAFLKKIYTQNELDYCLVKHNKYQHLAARFAAKEAIYKALSGTWSKVASWKNIEITNEQNGLPVVKFSGKLKDYLSDDKDIKISISHSDNYVACVALIFLK